jgi:transposase
MEKVPNGRYTKEFREETVKMVTDGGLSVLEVSSRLFFAEIDIGALAKSFKEGESGCSWQRSTPSDGA